MFVFLGEFSVEVKTEADGSDNSGCLDDDDQPVTRMLLL